MTQERTVMLILFANGYPALLPLASGVCAMFLLIWATAFSAERDRVDARKLRCHDSVKPTMLPLASAILRYRRK